MATPACAQVSAQREKARRRDYTQQSARQVESCLERIVLSNFQSTDTSSHSGCFSEPLPVPAMSAYALAGAESSAALQGEPTSKVLPKCANLPFGVPLGRHAMGTGACCRFEGGTACVRNQRCSDIGVSVAFIQRLLTCRSTHVRSQLALIERSNNNDGL